MNNIKKRVQKVGSALSGMVMPNIGAIIAWGLITALFMETGWTPNAQLAKMITPMLTFLLPILISYTGGYMVYEQRGAVVGAIAGLGVIVGTDVPMFLGAMIMGPFGGWCMKKVDQLFQQKIKSGFEMLYNNFSSGILGMILAIFGFMAVGPLVEAGNNFMSWGVDKIISVHLLPLANIFIEPAKILFLNNAINHGILTPLGTEQAAHIGKSILFLLEANPGPGLGILLAFSFFGKGSAKSSAPGAAIIQFFGGIHEIYFPYILMKPALFLSVIGGGITGTFTFSILDAGLKAPASPGSIIAVLLMTPQGEYLKILAGVAAAALVSFLISMVILKADKSVDSDFDSKKDQVDMLKKESKGQTVVAESNAENSDLIASDKVQRVIFACDAGMGSSAMGASLLRKKFKDAGIDIEVINMAINNLKDENNVIIITQEELAARALDKTPSAIKHVQVDNFLGSDEYDKLVDLLK